MAGSYTLKLGPTNYEGTVNGISISWSQNADTRLADDAESCGVQQEMLKGLTEHFAVLVTKQLQNSRVRIMGAPHDFTIDSKTGLRSKDALHIRITTKGPTRGGTHNVHIYLAGDGGKGDSKRFDALSLDGLSVYSRIGGGWIKDPILSTWKSGSNAAGQHSASN